MPCLVHDLDFGLCLYTQIGWFTEHLFDQFNFQLHHSNDKKDNKIICAGLLIKFVLNTLTMCRWSSQKHTRAYSKSIKGESIGRVVLSYSIELVDFHQKKNDRVELVVYTLQLWGCHTYSSTVNATHNPK